MNWGTFDANAHTPKTDIMDQPVSNGRYDQEYESRTTGGPDYTLDYVGHGEVSVPNDAPKND